MRAYVHVTTLKNKEAHVSVNDAKDLSEKLRVDMEVIGTDGNHIGRVQQVRPHDFLLHRPLSPSIFVPFGAVDTVSGKNNRVTLTVSEGEIAESGWAGLEADVSATRSFGGK